MAAGSRVHLEFGGERFVGLGEVGVGTVEVVDLYDEVLILRLVFLLEATRLTLQFRLHFHDGSLHVLHATCAVPPDNIQPVPSPCTLHMSATTGWPKLKYIRRKFTISWQLNKILRPFSPGKHYVPHLKSGGMSPVPMNDAHGCGTVITQSSINTLDFIRM